MNPLPCNDSYVNPSWIHTVIPAYIYTISALGILLNLLVLLVFLLHKKPCTATEIYLSNMAAADFFLAAFLPFWGVYVSQEQLWTFGEPMCKIVGLFIVMNYNCSVYFLVLVCVDRFLALVHPLSQFILRRRKYAKVSCIAVWCFGLLLNVPTLMCRQAVELEPEPYNETAKYDIIEHTCDWNCPEKAFLANEIVQSVVMFILPLLVISFCTVKILRALKERPRERVCNQKGEGKVTVLVLVVLMAFLICWLPLRVHKTVRLAMIFKLIEDGCTLVRVMDICQNVFVYLGFFNSDLNPILYVIVGKNFRKKMWEVLNRRGSVGKSSTQFTMSTSVLSSQKLQVNVNNVLQ